MSQSIQIGVSKHFIQQKDVQLESVHFKQLINEQLWHELEQMYLQQSAEVFFMQDPKNEHVSDVHFPGHSTHLDQQEGLHNENKHLKHPSRISIIIINNS